MSSADVTRFLAGDAKGGVTRAGAQGGGSRADSPRGESVPAAASGSLAGSRVGTYLITKRLGAGGVGHVFKGVDVMLKRDVAIKVLRDELACDPVFVKRFSNEAQLHAKLSHPNVASVHALLHEGDQQFLVMEYVPGISLDEFVRGGGPVPVQRALSIFRRALDGVDHAHSHGIVHRDIKPANIMLADSGQVKVMDFGIARAMDSQEHLTRVGHVAGTAKAMSPEQIRGKQADVRSDIYSLGIVLYTLLAGRPPFDSANDLELMKAQLEQAPPPLRGLVDSLPARVEAAVMRALQKDPAARFQSAREFAFAIDACLSDLALASTPTRIVAPPLDAPNESQTAINPAIQGVERLPNAVRARAESGSAMAGSSSPRWAGVAGVSLAVTTLAVAGVVAWWHLSHSDKATDAAPPTQVSQAPIHQAPSTGLAPQPAPAPIPEPAVVAPDMAQTLSPSAPLTMPQPSMSPSRAVDPVEQRRLTVVRLPARGNADSAAAPAAAAPRFKAGERIRLLVTPSDDSHVYCYLQDETKSIQRFYPNRFQESSLVRTAAPLEIPGRMRFELIANSRKVTETVACFATERDVVAELPASVVGSDFANLPVASLDEVGRAFARVAADTLAQGRFLVDAR